VSSVAHEEQLAVRTKSDETPGDCQLEHAHESVNNVEVGCVHCPRISPVNSGRHEEELV
jgi:hypothetical protein